MVFPANVPHPISLSLMDAANVTVTLLFINEPNKTGKTMATFHLPSNVLKRHILTRKDAFMKEKIIMPIS